MLNVSIASYAGWPAYDTFHIVSFSGRLVYDPNPLRSNPNPKKPVSGSCRVHGLGRTLTPLTVRNMHKQIRKSERNPNWWAFNCFQDSCYYLETIKSKNKNNICLIVTNAIKSPNIFMPNEMSLLTQPVLEISGKIIKFTIFQ